VKGRGLFGGRRFVFEGAGWVFKRALVVEEAPVGFLGGNRWCRRGSREGGGEGGADVATEAGAAGDDGVIGDVACRGAASRR